jgi:ATP-dependent protease ClpP protease subunit
MNYENIFINGLIGTIYDGQGNVKEKGVELIDVIKQVQNAPFAEGYNVYINSEGGVVETGFEIYDYLRSVGKPINTIGVNQVASIATVVFMAGDVRRLKTGTNFLIHLPMIGIDGFLNSQDLEQAKIDLQPIEKKLIDFYKKTTGLTEEAIAPLLRKETSLDPSTAFDLRFATEYDVEFTKAVAYLKKDNLITNNQMNENDKSWIEEKFGSILNLIKGKEPKKGFNVVSLAKGTIVNVDVTDANGTIVTFPEVADGTMPIVGDIATVDGKPVEGEYLMPDGSTFIFEGGVLMQIVEATEQEVDVTALQTEIETLKTQLATQTTNYETAIVNLKTQIVSKFEKPEPKDSKDDNKTNTRKLLK